MKTLIFILLFSSSAMAYEVDCTELQNRCEEITDSKGQMIECMDEYLEAKGQECTLDTLIHPMTQA